MRPGGGQPNMQQLMKQAQKMQEELQAAQAELASTEVTGTAGGGLVKATMFASGELMFEPVEFRSNLLLQFRQERRSSIHASYHQAPRDGPHKAP